MKWTHGNKFASILTSIKLVELRNSSVCPPQAASFVDVSLLSRLRQSLIHPKRTTVGLMEMRPRLNIRELSSLILAKAQNPRCEGMPIPHTEGYPTTVLGAEATTRVKQDLGRPRMLRLSLSKGCKLTAVMSVSGTNRKPEEGKGIAAQTIEGGHSIFNSIHYDTKAKSLILKKMQ